MRSIVSVYPPKRPCAWGDNNRCIPSNQIQEPCALNSSLSSSLKSLHQHPPPHLRISFLTRPPPQLSITPSSIFAKTMAIIHVHPPAMHAATSAHQLYAVHLKPSAHSTKLATSPVAHHGPTAQEPSRPSQMSLPPHQLRPSCQTPITRSPISQPLIPTQASAARPTRGVKRIFHPARACSALAGMR